MPRIEIPLLDRILQATGDRVLQARLILEVKDNQGTWVPFEFIVDPGTEMTTMPAADATKRDLPVPTQPARGLALRGQVVRRGLLRDRIPGLDATEYVFPCYHPGDEDRHESDTSSKRPRVNSPDAERFTRWRFELVCDLLHRRGNTSSVIRMRRWRTGRTCSD